MPPIDRPYLQLPFIGEVFSHQGSSGFPPEVPVLPEPVAQVGRLRGQISRLEQVMAARTARLQSDPAGAEPTEVLVLECAGAVDGFINAVRKTPELEWLGEFSREAPGDTEFYYNQDRSRAIPESVYLVMQDRRGQREFMRLWQLWEAHQGDSSFPHGQGKWKKVFLTLRKVRFWGPEDRITPGFREDWEVRVAAGAAQSVVEVECWYSANPQRRAEAITRLSGLVTAAGGQVLDTYDHVGIRYLGLLVQLPAAVVAQLIGDPASELVRADAVMYFLRKGQTLLGDLREDATTRMLAYNATPPITQSLVALIDGLPQENHPALIGCLRVSDPVDRGSTYPAQARVHGTSMASLICRGDLRVDGSPLQNQLLVAPVMTPNTQTGTEELPPDRLVVKLMVETVERIVSEAPTVRIINCSLGDYHRPFDRAPSPWARILDYLAHKHDLLMVVSVGNVSGKVPVTMDRTTLEAVCPRDDQLRTAMVATMRTYWDSRRLISPAEGINVLTVGSAHADSDVGEPPPREFDCLASGLLPATYSRQGPGANRATKPDIYVPGGRIWHRLDFDGSGNAPCMLEDLPGRAAPGMLVAAPGPLTAGSALVSGGRGTSVAAALTTRSLARWHEAIRDGLLGTQQIAQRHTPVLLKALAVHRASWGPAADLVRDPAHDQREHRRVCSRMLGFGYVDLVQATSGGSRSSVSLVALGALAPGKAARFRLPLPTELRGHIWPRKVITTLAWSSPIAAESTAYRAISMVCRLHGNQTESWSGSRVRRRPDPLDALDHALGGLRPTDRQVQSQEGGTVEHIIWEGNSVMTFDPASIYHLQVDCKQMAGTREVRAATYPFALVISLAFAGDIGIDLYARVQNAVRVPLGPLA